MSFRVLLLLAAGGSAAALAAALWFQHVAGLAPCSLCIWQRWPHGIAAGLGVAALALAASDRRLATWPVVAGGLAMLAGAGLGLYHTGVEQGLWAGPAACGAHPVAGLDPDELFARIMAAPVVRCDEVAWSFLGLSMAAWNAALSLGLAALWAAALGHTGRSQESSTASQ